MSEYSANLALVARADQWQAGANWRTPAPMRARPMGLLQRIARTLRAIVCTATGG